MFSFFVGTSFNVSAVSIHLFLHWISFLDFEGSWGYWSITVFQQVASLGNNIAIHIAAGTSLKVSLTELSWNMTGTGLHQNI